MPDARVDGPVGRLVVEHGDRVSATGRFVHFTETDWLDLAQISDLVLRPQPWKSSRSVRLPGVDVVAIPTSSDADPTFIPGQVQVTGLWRDDVIDIETQTTILGRATGRTSRCSHCPRPPTGGTRQSNRPMSMA